MASCVRAILYIQVISAINPVSVLAVDTKDACLADGGDWTCQMGCWDTEDAACHAGLDKSTCTEFNGHVEWSPKCNCRCEKMVCEMGCWDTEDEACHTGIDKNGCAEIYGHVEWSQKCNCRMTSGGMVLNQTSQRSAEAEEGQANIYFSVPAFVVLFRESFEVMIILAIVIQFLNKAHTEGTIDKAMLSKLRREVYLGAGLGFFLCMCIGALCILAASALYQLFEGNAVYWADGIMMTIACIFLTALALNFYKLIHTRELHERKLRKQVNEAITASAGAKQGSHTSFGRKYAFFFFALVTGLREGLESIIFLITVITDFPDPSYLASLPIPIITALVLSRILGYFFFQSTKRCNIKPFVRSACFGCAMIAAGMFVSSMHKWQELGLFGTWTPKSERPWLNHRVFDASGCCNDKTNKFFVLLRALCGWQDQPTPVEFFAFPLYWLVAAPLLIVQIRRWKKEVQEKLSAQRAEDLAAAAEPQGCQDEEDATKVSVEVVPEVAEQNEGRNLENDVKGISV
eukprot:TRINITY_DN2094_c0_g1_i1.p1 TRINITY_DN2094_c0_g1~~TRINITY_DN2094_c0_g1_i1.p1  ORF type:complete len:551 (-),score=85.30 TRINITY_DN2094_c0_g1_i1:565-2115(-)